MAYYNKIALLILNDDKSKFLAVRKYKQFVTDDYIMPGGKFEEASEEETLVAEIKEELNSLIDMKSLHFIGEYIDTAAGRPERDVSIRLYGGRLLSKPRASGEIESIGWLDKSDQHNPQVSPIIRNKIIPDLAKQGILR